MSFVLNSNAKHSFEMMQVKLQK